MKTAPQSYYEIMLSLFYHGTKNFVKPIPWGNRTKRRLFPHLISYVLCDMIEAVSFRAEFLLLQGDKEAGALYSRQQCER